MITQFRVQNFKALRDVTLDLTPIHVLIGPNDSGKTSILQAIEALSRSVVLPLGEAFAGGWDGSQLVWRHENVPVRFKVTAPIGENQCGYELACQFPFEGKLAKVHEERLISTVLPSFDLTERNQHRTFLHRDERRENPRPTIPDDLRPFLDLIRTSIRGAHSYRWDPSMLALPVAIDATRELRMETPGFGLVQFLDEILSLDRSAFAELEQRFFALFPQYEALRFVVTKSAFRAAPTNFIGTVRLQDAHGKEIVLKRKDGTEVPASQLSDGTLLILAYLAVQYSPQPPRFLLLEEPENGIHPARLKDVIDILRGLIDDRERTQVILTTHSPYVLDHFRPDEVTLCRMTKDKGEVEVLPLSKSDLVRSQSSLFTLGEIWTAEGDEALARPTEEVSAP